LGVGGNVVKSGFLLFLDQFLEGADRLGCGDFHWKDATWVIAKNKTVEMRNARHGV
jgi:hypothetical protein